MDWGRESKAERNAAIMAAFDARSTPSGGRSYSSKVSYPTAAGAAAVRKGGSAPGQSTPAEEQPWSPAPYDPDGDPVDGETDR